MNGLLVFVHGLGSDAVTAWGDIASRFWTEYRAADVAFFEYPSGVERIWRWHAPTPEELAETLAQEIREVPYDRVVLFGHSLGGLLCKAAIGLLIRENQKATLERLYCLFLVATPQAGSQRVPPLLHVLSSDLRSLRVHSSLQEHVEQMVRGHVDASFPSVDDQKVPIPTFVIRGQKDRVVDRLSSGLVIPSVQVRTVEGGHGITRVSADDAFHFMHRHVEQLLGSINQGLSDIDVYLDALALFASEPPSFMESAAPDLQEIDQRVSVVEPMDKIDLSNAGYSSGFFDDLHHLTGDTSRNGVDWTSLRGTLRYGVTLGDPGFGKSWLLRKEARRAVEELRQSQPDDPSATELALPFLVSVRDLAPRSDSGSMKLTVRARRQGLPTGQFFNSSSSCSDLSTVIPPDRSSITCCLP